LKIQSGQYKLVVAVDEIVGITIPEDSTLQDNDTSLSFQSTMSSIGLDVSRAAAGASTFISPYVQQCFLPAMRAIGMPNVACLAAFVVNSEEVGLTFKKNPKKHVIFTPLMVNGHQLSEVNSRLETEICTDHSTGRRCYNTYPTLLLSNFTIIQLYRFPVSRIPEFPNPNRRPPRSYAYVVEELLLCYKRFTWYSSGQRY
jgi:hypothetical protein